MDKKEQQKESLRQWEEQAAAYEQKRRQGLLRHKLPAEKDRDLQHALHALTKQELDDIRANLNLHGMSSLKKAELVEKLIPAVRHFAKIWFGTMVQEQYDFLQRLSEKKNVAIAAEADENDAYDSLLAMGLVGVGGDGGSLVWYLPQEIHELLGKEKDLEARVQQNSEIARLTRGLLFYYGFLSYEELLARLLPCLTTGTSVDAPHVVGVLMNVASWSDFIQIENDGVSYFALASVDGLTAEWQQRESLLYADPTPQQIGEAGDTDYPVAGPFAQPARAFLMKTLKGDKALVDDILLTLYLTIQNGGTLQDGLASLQEEDRLQLTKPEWEKLMPLLVAYNNEMPQWILKGHSPNSVNQAGHGGHIVSFGEHIQSKPKVGRNDPCPCGSGKKYKNCCLRKDEL